MNISIFADFRKNLRREVPEFHFVSLTLCLVAIEALFVIMKVYELLNCVLFMPSLTKI